jgi:hypothetical protein
MFQNCTWMQCRSICQFVGRSVNPYVFCTRAVLLWVGGKQSSERLVDMQLWTFRGVLWECVIKYLLLFSFNLIQTSFRYLINYLRNPNVNMLGVCRHISKRKNEKLGIKMTAINSLTQLRSKQTNVEHCTRHIRTNMSILRRKQYLFTIRPLRASNYRLSALI